MGFHLQKLFTNIALLMMNPNVNYGSGKELNWVALSGDQT